MKDNRIKKSINQIQREILHKPINSKIVKFLRKVIQNKKNHNIEKL